MAEFINLTKAEIHLEDGRVFPPSGTSTKLLQEFDKPNTDGVMRTYFKDPILPPAREGVYYIVSLTLLLMVGRERSDVVAPATGHPGAKRQNGEICSVPGFVRLTNV